MRRYLFIVMVLVLATPLVARQQSALELFNRGLLLERAEGKVTEAIAVYERVVSQFPGDREILPQALLRLAMAYESRGDARAVATYQRIVMAFGGPTETAAVSAVVATSRMALAAVEQKGAGLVVRQVPDAPADGRVSQDGRDIAFTAGGDVVIHELESGRRRTLTGATAESGDRTPGQRTGSGAAYAVSPVPSPDGRLIAYHWITAQFEPDEAHEVRVVGRDGGQPRVIYPKGNAFTATFGWSPDSKAILMLAEPKGVRELVLTPIDGGAPRSLKRLQNQFEWNFRMSPDGRFVAFDLQTTPGKSERDVRILTLDSGTEVSLLHPANEEMLGWFPEGDRILFASDRGGTWGIWAQRVINGRAQGEPALVRSDTGKVWPQGFTRTGTFYYGIVNEQLEVYVAPLDPATGQAGTLAPLHGRFVGNKSAAVWSPAGDRLAYVQSGTNTLVIQTTATGDERPLRLALQSIGNPSWSRDGKSVVIEGQSLDLRPGLYQVNIETGVTTMIVDQDPGRRAAMRRNQPAPAANGRVYFSRTPPTSNVATDIAVRDLNSGVEQVVVTDTIRTFALSPDGQWLAVARPGGVPAPRLLLYSTLGGAPRPLGVSPDDPVSRALAWSRDSRFVFVTRPAQRMQEVWRFAVDGSEPVNTGVRPNGAIERIDVHPDGRQMALSTRGTSSETWVLQNIPPPREK